MNFASRNSALTILLVILVCFAAYFRIKDIGAESLWNDELESWRQSSVSSISEVIENVRRDVHPPGYQLLLYYVMRYFGDTEAVLRAPSAIAGVLSVLLLYLFGKRLYSREVGLLAAAILTVSWSPIFYAQEARAYSVLFLAALASTFLFFELVHRFRINSSSGKLLFISYILVALATCYTHYFGLLLIASHGFLGVILLWNKPRIMAKLLAAFAIILALFAPWIPSMLDQMSLHREYWIAEPGFFGLLVSLFFFAYKVPVWFGVTFLLPVCILFFAQAQTSATNRKENGPSSLLLVPDIFLILTIVLPFLASYIQSVISSPVVTLRNLIILLPSVYLLMARGVQKIPFAGARLVLSIVMVFAIGYFTFVYYGYYEVVKKQQFREAAEYLLEHDVDDDVIAFTWSKRYFEYYFERAGSPKKVGLIAGDSEDIPSVKEFLAESQAHGFWYLAGHREPDTEFLEFLETTFTLVESRQFVGASARRYELP